ncbi:MULTISPECIES: adenosine kinase [Prochlorococcus]|uniref:adenosine kinase n=1 Tax=Prochlorococcus TaxID=1218 RepID=UPI000533AEB7|nr:MULTISPECIES: adenosine kinase [Prochlorococcus]KGG12886.1 Fructokinase [Prochlorococcus sp. MIT 0601]
MKKGDKTLKKQFDVVGIGNSIVDILVHSTDTFLEQNSLTKGSMTLVDQSKAEELYLVSGPGLESSGGSAANTIAGLAQLGIEAGFIGRVKNDDLGKIFTHDICSTGANYQTPPIDIGPSTARCLILITPDAQRTMCTYLGASVFLNPQDIDLSLVKQAKVLYLEGYLWDHPEAKKAFITSAKECKSSGGKIALSLSDAFCVERHRESFQELISNYIDIIFANEGEIISLYKSKGLDEAKSIINKHCDISVLTMGENGSIIISGGNCFTIKPYRMGEVIDTTGAGDLYASGFLYGYSLGKSLDICGQIGSICAGHIVTQVGTRSQIDLKKLVNNYLDET